MSTNHIQHDSRTRLILHRASKTDLDRGIPVITRGEGVYIYDSDGRRYLDLVSGVTRPVHVGYGRQEIAQAVYDQIMTLHYFTPIGYSNIPAILLADRLAELVPGKINRFFFVCDGSEAVDSAIKFAQHYHAFRGEKKRYKVISRRGAYHGTTGLALRSLGTVLPMRQIMEPLPPGAVFVESPYCYRCPYHLTYPGCEVHCARDVARIIEFEDPGQVSAFLGEPVQQGFGAMAPVPEYWPIIQDICRQYGVLLIIDEVICGFGRTGKWFGHQHFAVEPDLMTMAKGLSSGYVPLGGVGCTDEVLAPIDNFHHLHTYGNHPVSCAAALKNLEIMTSENLIDNAVQMGQYFLEGLQTLEKYPIVGQARGVGLWTALDLTANKETKAPFSSDTLAAMVRQAREKGLIIKFMGMALEFAPPLTINRGQIDEALRVIEEIVAQESKNI